MNNENNNQFDNFNQENNEPRTDFSAFRSFSQPENSQPFAEPTPEQTSYESSAPQVKYDYHYETPVVTVKKTNKKSIKVVALILICAIVSTACGFGGSLLASKLNPTPTDPTQTIIKEAIVEGSNTGADEYSISDIVATCENTVVEITTETMQTNMFMQQYVSEGAGSGVIFSSNGYIVTNNHVIEKSSSIKVTLKDGTEHKASLVGTDPETDIAVIKINKTGLNSATLGDSSKIVVGELAIAIGNPLGTLGGTVTDGIISALDREINIDGENMRLLQTNAAVNPGNSGGGLFNSKGQLIGIVNAKTSSSGIEGLGFAIPINTAKKVANDIINYGYVKGRVALGAELVEINNAIDIFRYGVTDTGLYVLKVYTDSAAHKGGLQAGDRIITVNSTAVKSETDLDAILDKSNIGDVLTFEVSRNGAQKTLKVVLAEKTSA